MNPTGPNTQGSAAPVVGGSTRTCRDVSPRRSDAEVAKSSDDSGPAAEAAAHRSDAGEAGSSETLSSQPEETADA